MAKSSQAEKVDAIQAAVHAALKSKGFKKQGRVFNRSTADGLIQVIQLQMGRHDPPGTVHIPKYREDRYGWFTVRLGVYVPEVDRLLRPFDEARRFIHEAYCCIREDLGSLGEEKTHLWWRNDAAAQVIPDLLPRLDRDALPFLDRLGSRDDILRELEASTSVAGPGGPPRIVRAIIIAERGDKAGAKALLARQASEAPHDDPHLAYLHSVAARLGIALDED